MDHKELAKHLNTMVYHSRMVDSLDEMLNDTSDLSIYWCVLLSVRLSVSASFCVHFHDPLCSDQAFS